MKKYILILAVIFSAVSFVSFNQVETIQESQALLKLKEAKEMSELGFISQDDYNNLLNKLKPILKN